MKPGDFFLGITDFFSIMLPGAGIAFIAMFLARQVEVPPDHVLHALLSLSGSAAWAAFAVCSYALGHIVGSAGSHLDPLYDERRRHRGNKALKAWVDVALVNLQASATHSSPPVVEPTGASRSGSEPVLLATLVGTLVWRAWKKPREPLAESGQVRPDGEKAKEERPINAYKLTRAILGMRAPTLFADVQRYEADSKFFRSLVVVAAFAFGACIVQLAYDLILVAFADEHLLRALWALGYLVFVFLILQISFVRYCELRLKATETAFQGLFALQVLPTASQVVGPPSGAAA